VIVQAPACQDHLGVVTDLLGFVGEIVGIDTDAVTADEAGSERQKIPFRSRRIQYFFRIDSQAVEYQCQLVDQRDIDIALVFSMTLAASATLMLEAR